MNKRRYIFLTVVGILAAWVSTASDVMLLFDPAGDYFSSDASFLLSVPRERAGTALLLGCISIPLLLAGLPPSLALLRKGGATSLLVGKTLAVLTIITGLGSHFSFYKLLHALQGGGDISWWQGFMEIVSTGFATCFLLLFAGFVALSLMQLTTAPFWFNAFNPIFTIPLIVLLWWMVPSIGKYLLPAAFNLSVGIFYCALLALQLGDEPPGPPENESPE